MSSVSEVLTKNLIFVGGKGGVGKTMVSRAAGQALSAQGKKTLWVTIEDPVQPLGQLKSLGPNFWHLNCDAGSAFEEYAALKIGFAPLARVFLRNKLMRYLAKAAPGIHELVLMGKIWFERANYDHVIVDMPSTGYGIAMFQSTENFAKLFHGGPIHRDARAMHETFSDSSKTGHLIVALPEEMPLQESLELESFLKRLFPKNQPAFLVNRKYPGPKIASKEVPDDPDLWPSPVASSTEDYLKKRLILEDFNLTLWREKKIPFGELEYVPPPLGRVEDFISERLASQMRSKAYL